MDFERNGDLNINVFGDVREMTTSSKIYLKDIDLRKDDYTGEFTGSGMGEGTRRT